jgi:predicted amidohydrolase YtcJ
MNHNQQPYAKLLANRTITNCYDSHLHWLATGQFKNRVQLHHLRDPRADVPRLEISSELRGRPWLMGFGWDQNLFYDKGFPTHEILDEVFADKPVYFIRVDGHAAWVNRLAFEKIGLWQKNPPVPEGGAILLKPDGYPSGIVLDLAMMLFEREMPKPTAAEVRADLLQAQAVFLEAGFTHIRDMSCDNLQWQEAVALEESGELNLFVEQFFSADDPSWFDDQLRKACEERAARAARPNAKLRVAGVKIYVDGALGSEGALMSEPYSNSNNLGLQLLDDATLRDFISRSWAVQMPVAIHVIGDEAAHKTARIALDLQEHDNLKGELHFEHAELLRPDTIQLLRKLDITCHFQPCHYLSDRRWLADKIGKRTEYAFRWNDLEKNDIKFDFGSDSPIEPPSLLTNLESIDVASADGIPAPKTSPLYYQSHRDLEWSPNTRTVFVDGKVAEVFVLGKSVFKAPL